MTQWKLSVPAGTIFLMRLRDGSGIGYIIDTGDGFEPFHGPLTPEHTESLRFLGIEPLSWMVPPQQVPDIRRWSGRVFDPQLSDPDPSGCLMVTVKPR